MNIINTDSRSNLSRKYYYNQYNGSPEDCIREFEISYPHYNPGTAFYIPAEEKLFVPMSWKNEHETDQSK